MVLDLGSVYGVADYQQAAAKAFDPDNRFSTVWWWWPGITLLPCGSGSASTATAPDTTKPVNVATAVRRPRDWRSRIPHT